MSVAVELFPHASRPSSRLTALWALYGLTVRQHLHGKRWMVVSLLMALPVVLAVIVRLTTANADVREIEFYFEFMVVPHVLLPLIALIYAAGIIQDEQEEQTLTYLLIRPIPKWALYLVKLAATVTTTAVLTALAAVAGYAAIYLGTGNDEWGRRCLTAMGIHVLAVTTYCCLFGFMSLMTRWALVAGLFYIAVVELLFANLEFGIRLLTVVYYTRLIAYHNLDFRIERQGNEDLAAKIWQYDLVADPQLANHPTVAVCVLVLLAAGAVTAVLASLTCAGREFYVKTPEGG